MTPVASSYLSQWPTFAKFLFGGRWQKIGWFFYQYLAAMEKLIRSGISCYDPLQMM